MGAPSWNTWSIREQCKARQDSWASSATPGTREEHIRQQSGSEVPVSSGRRELLAPKVKHRKLEALPTKALGSGAKNPRKKAKTGSTTESKKPKIAPTSSQTDESDPVF